MRILVLNFYAPDEMIWDFVFALSVYLFVFNFNLTITFLTMRNRDLLFGMHNATNAAMHFKQHQDHLPYNPHNDLMLK